MSSRISLIIMIIFTGLLFNGCGQSIREMLNPGVSKQLADYRKKFITQVEYELFFNIPESRETPMEGKVKINFHQSRAQRGVIFDFRAGDQNIHNVIVNGHNDDYQYLNEHIIISSRNLRPGKNTVEIEFTATDHALNRSEEFMYTLFVPDRASTAFPCFDQPDLKATFSLTLSMPAQWTALSNGPQTADSIHTDRRVMSFAPTLPISTYLFAFTAGDFQKVSQTSNGRTINILHRETDAQKLENNLPEIFKQHFQALHWLEKYTAIDYPFEKFDLAIIPGFQYSGMEHPGAVWYRDTRLLLDDNASVSQKLQKANLIAHETAHMWFGNLVTMKWFDDVWLKEVFAGFMADKMVQPMFPGENHQLQFLLSHFPRAYGVDRSRGTHPIRQNLSNLNQAGNLYGAVIYNKAPVVFQQLELIMGEEPFRNAVKEYLEIYSFNNADWDQLVTIFNRHSSENISEWSNAWVYGKGMPRIEYNLMSEKTKQPAIEFLSEIQENKYYPSQYIGLVLLSQSENRHNDIFLSESNITYTLDNPYEPSAVILPNGAARGYGNFVLRNHDRDFLLNHASHIEDENLRAAAHLLLFEDFLNLNISPADYLKTLEKSIGSESNSIITTYLLGNLQTIYWVFLTSEQRYDAAGNLSPVLWELLHKAPPEMKSSYLKTYADIALQQDDYVNLIKLFDGQITFNDYELSEDDRFALASSLCIRQHKSGEQLLQQLLEQTTNPDRAARIKYLSEILLADEHQRQEFFEKLQHPANRRPEPWALEGLAVLHHPLHWQSGIAHLAHTLQMTEEIQRTGDIFFPLRWLEAALGGYSDKKALQIVEQYLVSNPGLDENLRLKVLQASDMLERSVRIKEKYQ